MNMRLYSVTIDKVLADGKPARQAVAMVVSESEGEAVKTVRRFFCLDPSQYRVRGEMGWAVGQPVMVTQAVEG